MSLMTCDMTNAQTIKLYNYMFKSLPIRSEYLHSIFFKKNLSLYPLSSARKIFLFKKSLMTIMATSNNLTS